MKITKAAPPIMLAASLAAMLALAACGNNGQPATPAPDGALTPTPQATAPTDTTAADANKAAVSVTTVQLGNAVGPDHQVTTAASSFAPADTIYASVTTNGSGNATLEANWTYQDGQTVSRDSKTIASTGADVTTFNISKPGGLPAGNYTVEISLDGNMVASKNFAVR